jgi:hypothetical protein
MPSKDFIDVRTVCDGRPLAEYPDLEDKFVGEDSPRRYVEAKTNQHFGIQVTLLHGFNFERAPSLNTQVVADDSEDCVYYAYRKASLDYNKGQTFGRSKCHL